MPRNLLVNGMTVEDLLEFHHGLFGDSRMDDPPERPSDVPQEEWDALGDPGRRALDRVRRTAREAERARDAALAAQTTAAQERDAARAELEQTRRNPPPGTTGAAGGEPPDVAAQIQAAVDSTAQRITQEYTQQLEALRAERAAEQITAHAQRIAADVLVDPSLVGTFVDLTGLLNPQTGGLDEQALRDHLATLVEQRPYLRRPEQQTAPLNPFGGHPGGARPVSDKATFDARVADALTQARQMGLRVRSDPATSPS